MPPHIDGDLDDLPAIARRSTFNSVEAHEWILQEPDRWRQGVQAYLASMADADAMVGRLLEALDASGGLSRGRRSVTGPSRTSGGRHAPSQAPESVPS